MCDTNFGPPGQCNECLTGWGGSNCDACALGWTGDNCDACATGWFGDNCDVCEFGFNTTTNCTEYIKNGKWTQSQGLEIIIYLTFDGPSSSNLVSGADSFPNWLFTADKQGLRERNAFSLTVHR